MRKNMAKTFYIFIAKTFGLQIQFRLQVEMETINEIFGKSVGALRL